MEPKPQPDDEVELVISRPEVYGLWSTLGAYEVLIPIPETSWIASYCSCHQVAEEGDRVRATVLAVDHDSLKITASLRAGCPSPWRPDGPLQQGVILTGEIVRRVEEADRCDDAPGYLLRLLPGCLAMLCDTPESLRPGDRCEVKIKAVIPERRTVRLSYVGKTRLP